MPEGKYFLIRSKLNPDLALDVEGAKCDPGTKVITYSIHGGDNQLWYVDHATGTIRSKASKLCLDLEDNRLVINPYAPGNANQQWEIRGPHICCRHDTNKVLDIVAACADEATEVCCWDCHGGDNQSWIIEHKDPEYFYIESKLHGKVMDVAGADPSPGAKVIIWPRKDETEDNQLWYEDKNSIIRSKLNDLVIDGSQGSLVTGNFNPGEQLHWWVIHDDMIANRYNTNQVLDISQASEDDGAEIIPYDVHGGNNQRWNFVKVY